MQQFYFKFQVYFSTITIKINFTQNKSLKLEEHGGDGGKK